MKPLSALILILVSVGGASAATLTYTIQASGSGSLGGVPFTDSLVSFSLIGNTDNVRPFPASHEYRLDSYLMSVTVDGLGRANFTDINPGSLAFADVTEGGNIGLGLEGTVILGTTISALSSYDLRSPIGPLTGNTVYLSAPVPFFTDRGTFYEKGFSSFPVFSATPTPEPNEIVTLALGLCGIGLYMAVKPKRNSARVNR